MKKVWGLLLSVLLAVSGGCSEKIESVETEETVDTGIYYLCNHMEEKESWLYYTNEVVNNNVQAKDLIQEVGIFPDKEYTVAYKETIMVEDSRIKQFHFEERYKGIPVWGTDIVATAYLDGTVITGEIIEDGFPEEKVFLSKDKLISDYRQEYHIKEEECKYLGLYYFKKEKIYFCHALRIYPDSKTDATYILLNATAGNVEGCIPDMIP